MTPDPSDFLKKAKQGNVIPVYQELLADLETPVSAFLKIAQKQPYAFLLESVVGEEKVARYSFVGTSPLWIWKSRGKTFEKIVGQKKIQGRIGEQGTGHGRPWLSTVTASEARAAVEAMGVIAGYMLEALGDQKIEGACR